MSGNRLAELHVMVQDDDGMGCAPEFLGECYIGLNPLGWVANKPGGASITCKLQDNDDKASGRQVKGTVDLNLLYQPVESRQLTKIEEEKLLASHVTVGGKNRRNQWENPPVPALRGALSVEVKSADGLLNLDSGFGGLSDPFCRIALFPDQKELEWRETKVVPNTLSPSWGQR